MSLAVWLRLGRVSNLPTVWTNVLAAAFLAGALPSLGAASGLCATFSAFYVGGMFLNDAFDAEIDARERPERPIAKGLVSRRSVFVAGFLALGLGMLSLGLCAWLLEGALGWALLSGAVLAGLIVFYDAYHKENPLSPLVMGLCRVGVYAGAALAVWRGAFQEVAWGALVLLAYLIGLTYAAKQEAYNRLESFWPLSLLSAPLVYGMSRVGTDPFVWGVILVQVFWLLHTLKFLWPGPNRSVPEAVGRLIAGISLLDAVLIATTGEVSLAIVACALCGLTRLLQQVVPGT